MIAMTTSSSTSVKPVLRSERFMSPSTRREKWKQFLRLKATMRNESRGPNSSRLRALFRATKRLPKREFGVVRPSPAFRMTPQCHRSESWHSPFPNFQRNRKSDGTRMPVRQRTSSDPTTNNLESINPHFRLQQNFQILWHNRKLWRFEIYTESHQFWGAVPYHQFQLASAALLHGALEGGDSSQLPSGQKR